MWKNSQSVCWKKCCINWDVHGYWETTKIRSVVKIRPGTYIQTENFITDKCLIVY